MKRHLCLTFILASSIALAGENIPAQPVTNLRTATKKDASEDCDPFNITQLDDRLMFFARNNTGYGLYVRDLANPDGTGSADPIVDLTLKKHTPVKVKQFKATQQWDPVGRNLAIIDNYNLGVFFKNKPTEGTLFFHVPSQGLWYSKATAGSTKKVLDVDLAPDNSEFRWLDYLVAHRSGTDEADEAVFFAGEDKKGGVELFKAPRTNKPKARLFADIVAGAGDSFPYEIVSSFRDLYFGAANPTTGNFEVYHSDGENPPTPFTSGLAEFPDWITADGNGGVYYTAPETAGGVRDLYHLDNEGTLTRKTTGGVNPSLLTYSGSGSVHLFSGVDALKGREVFSVSHFSSAGDAELKFDINPLGSSNPAQFTAAPALFTYFTAFDGTARKLYRSSGTILENIVEQNTNVPIIMDDTSEILPVQIHFAANQDLGDWVYFTGTPQGGTTKLLYRVNNSDFNQVAIRVKTPAGNDVRNARHLGKFVSPGLGTYRLYFSCDGEGTEFSDASASDKRFQPRGYELWCTEVGDTVAAASLQ